MHSLTKPFLLAGALIAASFALPTNEANACVHTGPMGNGGYAVVQNNCGYAIVARVYKSNGSTEIVGPISSGGYESANVRPENVVEVKYCSKDDWARNICKP